MYTFEFRSFEDGLRIRLDMTKTEALMEKPEGTVIVTSSDTYYVRAPFDEVDQAWQDAMNFETAKTSNISANTEPSL